MTWVKFEDSLPEHPKIARVTPAAAWLYFCGVCYCNRNLTDGFIPRAPALRLIDAGHDESIRLIDALIGAGLWAVTDGGFDVHDYTGHQRSRAEIESSRRGGRSRQQKWRERNAVTPPSTNALLTSAESESESESEKEREREREKGGERADAPTIVLSLDGLEPVTEAHVARWNDLRTDDGLRVFRDVLIPAELESMREYLGDATASRLPKKSLPQFALNWLKRAARDALVTRRARNREDRQQANARAGTEQQLAEMMRTKVASDESLEAARVRIRKTFGGNA